MGTFKPEAHGAKSGIEVYAKTLPCLKSDGHSRFFMTGDVCFFKELGMGEYLLGRLDGRDHGPTAGIMALAAKMCIEESIAQGRVLPKDIAAAVNDKIVGITGPMSFTAASLSYITPGTVRITNAGDGQTHVYFPRLDEIVTVGAHGLPLGAFPLSSARAPYGEDVFSREGELVIVGYSDGIEDAEGFDPARIKDIIRGRQPDPQGIVEGILEYSLSLFHPAPDDACVIAACLPAQAGPGTQEDTCDLDPANVTS